MMYVVFFFQAEDGIRDLVRSRGLGDVYKRQNYYINENINERPDDKYTFVGYENHIFKHMTTSQIKELLKKYQP